MMEHEVLIGLTSIVVLGMVAQWVAWRFRLPSILLLLVLGFLAGPVTGFLHPDQLLGDLLHPFVSISVALILFEGGLDLRLRELREVGLVVRNLITLGALVTWLLGAAAAYVLLDVEVGLALLLGGILVVSGPTVIGPLLSHVRPNQRVGSVLKWESILIDPVGALLAVLIFEVIVAHESQSAAALVAAGVLKTIVVGGAVGLAGAGLLWILLRYYWVPDFLQNPLTLMIVIGVFTLSNLAQSESGLLAATLMGVALTNQRVVPIRHIVEFKETLRVLLISTLFILLAARLELSDLTKLTAASVPFLILLMAVARPLSVFASTAGSKLKWNERVFLSWMAPRGIVAAAIASLFAFRLEERGYAGAELLVPVTFLVIVVTVAFYGLTAAPVAKLLKVAQPNPQGVMVVGAHEWGREIARVLQQHKFAVLVVDTNEANIAAARLAGLPTHLGNVLSENVWEEIELDQLGRLLALTPNDEVNSLAALHFAKVFGSREVYQLPPKRTRTLADGGVSRPLRGRYLFGEHVTYEFLSDEFARGGRIKATKLTKAFDFADFLDHYEEEGLPLFLIEDSGVLVPVTRRDPPRPRPNQTLISLVPAPAAD